MKMKENVAPKSNKNSQHYHQIADNQKELGDYLHYIRHQKPPTKIKITYPHFDKFQSKDLRIVQPKSNSSEVVVYVEKYMRLLKDVSLLESYATKKIFKKTLQFLEQFPSMTFLYEVINSFGKDQKKLSLNQSAIMAQATDEMVPLFQKII